MPLHVNRCHPGEGTSPIRTDTMPRLPTRNPLVAKVTSSAAQLAVFSRDMPRSRLLDDSISVTSAAPIEPLTHRAISSRVADSQKCQSWVATIRGRDTGCHQDIGEHQQPPPVQAIGTTGPNRITTGIATSPLIVAVLATSLGEKSSACIDSDVPNRPIFTAMVESSVTTMNA